MSFRLDPDCKQHLLCAAMPSICHTSSPTGWIKPNVPNLWQDLTHHLCMLHLKYRGLERYTVHKTAEAGKMLTERGAIDPISCWHGLDKC